MWISFTGTEPLYRQVYQTLRAAILRAELPAGTRLPPTRLLAREHGISRNVVLLAYEQLVAEGYAEARVGSGTWVAASLPETLLQVPGPASKSEPRPARRGPDTLSPYGAEAARLTRAQPWITGRSQSSLRCDFRYGVVEPDEPALIRWRRLLARHAQGVSLDYQDAAGYPPLREALAAYARASRGIVCRPQQVVIVSGAQQGLDLVARVLLDRGDRVVIEEPQYLGARFAFQAAGARLVPLAVDAHGLDITAARKRIRQARLAYVTPSHQFPTGAVMPLERRSNLLEWAYRYGAFIVEDDYDSEYRYQGRPIEAIQALDPDGRTIYVGTLSKVLFPSLRLGFLILPSRLVDVFVGAKWLSDRHASTLLQATLASFLTEGHFERHLRRMRTRNANRRSALLEAIDRHLEGRVAVQGTNAGIHLLLWLKGLPVRKLPELVTRAAARGVGLYPVRPYYLRPPRKSGLLLGYASLTEAQIRAGVARIAAVLAELEGR